MCNKGSSSSLLYLPRLLRVPAEVLNKKAVHTCHTLSGCRGNCCCGHGMPSASSWSQKGPVVPSFSAWGESSKWQTWKSLKVGVPPLPCFTFMLLLGPEYCGGRFLCFERETLLPPRVGFLLHCSVNLTLPPPSLLCCPLVDFFWL